MNFATSFGLSLLALFVLPVLISGCLSDGRNGASGSNARAARAEIDPPAHRVQERGKSWF
jgi:hypothetical protein